MAQLAPVLKGSNSSKADGALGVSTLAVNDVGIEAGNTIKAAVIFWSTAGNPTIKYGNKTLRRDKTNEFGVGGFRVQLYKARVKNTKVPADGLDVVAAWGTETPGARAIIVFEDNEASLEDVSVVNDNTNSTTPNTSSAGDSTVANTLSIALFGSNGPSTDVVNSVNLGHTSLARVGTTGGLDDTNLTLQVTYELLTAIGVVRGSLTVATARDWANLIVAYKSVDTYTITNTYHRPWKTYPGADVAIFEVENSSSVRVDDILIPRGVIEQLTDAQVTEYIAAELVRESDIVTAENEKETADSTLETRLATFENDTVTI